MMNSQSDADLFATPQEKAAKLDIDQRELTESEITTLCECPDILIDKLQSSVANVTLPEFQNTINIIKSLIAQRRRLSDIVSGIVRCRRCAYTFYMKEKSGDCPKCGVGHIRG
jgi:rRNA maturation endonuclease Nob1